MRRIAIVITVLVAIVFTGVLSSAVELEEILAMNYETRGGLDKLKSIQSLRIHGKTLFMGQIEAPMLIEIKRPNRFRMEFTVQGMTGIQAFDGEIAWMLMPFTGQTDPEVLPEAQAKDLRREADLDGPLVDWQKKGHKIELVGTEDLEGTEAYKLKLIFANGDVNFIYLDSEFCIQLMHKGTTEIPGQSNEVEVITTMSDYKEVGGVMMAHATESKMGDQIIAVVTMDTVEVNPDIADGRFKMPEPVAPETSATDG